MIYGVRHLGWAAALVVASLWLGIGSVAAALLPLSPAEEAWLKQHDGAIRVGVTEVAPLMMRDRESGGYRGFAIDYLRLHETRLGIHFQIEHFPTWAAALEAAREKRVDVLLPTVRTPERETYLLFPPPYATLHNKIIVRRGEFEGREIGLEDLTGKRVSVMLNSAAHEKLRREYPLIRIVPAPDEKQVLTAVAFHHVDAGISELGRATYYLAEENLTNLAVAGDARIDYPIAMAVRNDWPQLAEVLTRTVQSITPEEHEEIRRRWVPIDSTDVFDDPLVQWATLGGAALLLVSLFGVFAWNRSLSRLVGARTEALNAQLSVVENARRAVAESEARFRTLAEMASDWFWEQDTQFRFTRFYGGNAMRTELDLDRFLGKCRWEMPIASVSESEWAAHRALLERHEPFRDFVYQTIRRDGVRRWLTTSGVPVFASDGGFLGYRGTARDITADRSIEEELRQRYQQVRALLDGAYSFVGLLEPDGTLIEVNTTALEFIGAARSQVVGRPFWDTPWWTDPPSRERLREAIRQGREGRFSRFETLHPDRDGALHWVDFSLSPIHDEQGKVVFLVPEGRDITDGKRALDALRALVTTTGAFGGEAFLRELVAQLARMLQVRYVFVAEVIEARRRVRTLALWENDRIVDNIEYDLLDTPCENVSGGAFCCYPRGVAAAFPKDVLLTQMGIESYMGVAVTAGDGSPIGILVVLHDKPLPDTESARHLMELFSARAGMEIVRQRHERAILDLNHELERRVGERTAQLEAANKELEAFSYSVSHDLRAPLRHIGGFVQLLEKESGAALPSESQRYLQIIAESAWRMGVLIDDLLAFSRIGRAELRTSPVHLDKLVEEVCQEFAGELAGRQVEWVIGPLPEVQADRAMLRQALSNLVGNAVKYTRRCPVARIEIGEEAGQPDGQHVFYVRDNGVGFNMKYVGKLFGVFQRLHGASEFEGTGIGLANVRRIIEKHGGRVWAEAVPGEGACFRFTLSGASAQDEATLTPVARVGT